MCKPPRTRNRRPNSVWLRQKRAQKGQAAIGGTQPCIVLYRIGHDPILARPGDFSNIDLFTGIRLPWEYRREFQPRFDDILCDRS